MELPELLEKITSGLSEPNLVRQGLELHRIAQVQAGQIWQQLATAFSARHYPVASLDWFPARGATPDDPKFTRVLQQVLQIPRNSWRSWDELAARIQAAAPKIQDYASFARMQAIRRNQLDPRYRVQQEEASMVGQEYKSRAQTAVLELLRLLPSLVFNDPRGQSAQQNLLQKLRLMQSGFETTTGPQIAKNLSIIQQYLEAVALRSDFVKEGPDKPTIVAHNAAVLQRFRTLTEALGYRRGAETQRA